MDPISITGIVIGVVIVVAEACRYVKKKFFHHKEERHEEGIIIKADELTMNGADLRRMQFNEDTQDTQDTLDASHHHDFHGKKIKITITGNSSYVDHLSKERREHGNSKVSEKLADHFTTTISAPAVSNTVGDIVKEQVVKFSFKNLFKKHVDKKHVDKKHSVQEGKDQIVDDDSLELEESVMMFFKGGKLYSEYRGGELGAASHQESSVVGRKRSASDTEVYHGVKLAIPSVHDTGVASLHASPVMARKSLEVVKATPDLYKEQDIVAARVEENKISNNEPVISGDNVEDLGVWF